MKNYRIMLILVIVSIVFQGNQSHSDQLIAGKFPLIQQIDTTYRFDDAKNAYIELYINSLNDDSLYCLKCDNYWHADSYPDDRYDFSGEFECNLRSINGGDFVSNLLTENPKQTSDWDSVRARFFSMDLTQEWLNYPDYGRIRTFHLKGMQLIFIMKNIGYVVDTAVQINDSSIDTIIDRRFDSYDFQVIILPDPTSTTEIAESSRFIKPYGYDQANIEGQESGFYDVKINTIYDSPNTIMSIELVELADKNGYFQIDNYFSDMPVKGEAPFLWGVNNNKDRYLSVMFWCQKKTDSISNQKSYYLIYAEKENWYNDYQIQKVFDFNICKDLFSLNDTTFSSDSFRFIDNYENFYPDTVTTSSIAVKLMGNGDEMILTYFKNHWLIYKMYNW